MTHTLTHTPTHTHTHNAMSPIKALISVISGIVQQLHNLPCILDRGKLLKNVLLEIDLGVI